MIVEHATASSAVLHRLCDATNRHDLNALTACFAADYQSVWPAHPARTFTGVEQVRQNWEKIFRTVPDVRVEVTDTTSVGDDVWSEWLQTGTRSDGVPFRMCGVIIFTVRSGEIVRGRFYLEPIDLAPVDATAAVDSLVGGTSAARTLGGVR